MAQFGVSAVNMPRDIRSELTAEKYAISGGVIRQASQELKKAIYALHNLTMKNPLLILFFQRTNKGLYARYLKQKPVYAVTAFPSFN